MNLTTTEKRVVGVDISTESTTYAIVDVRGNILVKDSIPTGDFPDVNYFVAHLSERILEMVMAHGGIETVRSVGVSSNSANFLTGCIERAPNLLWKGVVPIAAMMRDSMGLAVAIANNAHVAALAEHAFGCAHGMKNFIVVSMGSGLGSCLFSNGQVHLGSGGFAGEVGHTCLIPGGRPCGCGARGCLESYTAASGIVQTARELLEESGQPSLMRGIDRLTPHRITDCCEQGDELAIETYRRTGRYLGIGLANYASMADPEAIIFTGGIAKASHWLMDPAYEAFNEHVFHNVNHKVRFMLSSLEEAERGILGASVLAWEVKEYSLCKE